MTSSTLDAARDYHRRGWRVVPIPAGEKGPHCPGWQNLDLGLDELPQAFGADANIGTILGRRSGHLADGDLDCREALGLADIYLPPSRAEFGRVSKPRSHRLYIAQGAIYEAFTDPTDGSVLLELRADGRDGGCHQTVFPPSRHPSGELIEWHGAVIAPAVVRPGVLRMRMAYLAIACLVARHISCHAAERPGPDLQRLLWEWDQSLGRVAYRWLGKPAPDAPRRDPPRRQLSRRNLDLAGVVNAIPNDCDWNGWNRVGMAVFSASGGSEEGFVIFDDWSAKSPKYQPHAVEERWRNYRRSPPTRIGMGSLVQLARQCGWTPRVQSTAT
jgi:Primase C terminal 2 (PriCT-2)/Bifunctional DNA primase/polymerase, N-terminal